MYLVDNKHVVRIHKSETAVARQCFRESNPAKVVSGRLVLSVLTAESEGGKLVPIALPPPREHPSALI